MMLAPFRCWAGRLRELARCANQLTCFGLPKYLVSADHALLAGVLSKTAMDVLAQAGLLA